jgi:nucleotide-binding universal stress UspA family protein
MFNKILIPVDGSQGAFEALKYAIEMHKANQAELIVLSVYREHAMWTSSVSWVNQERTASTEDAMKEFAKEVAEKSKQYALDEGVAKDKVRSFYIGGGPAREIVKSSEKHGVDLIILGSRGLSDSSKHLLGSVSHKVTSLAQCPVLVV